MPLVAGLLLAPVFVGYLGAQDGDVKPPTGLIAPQIPLDRDRLEEIEDLSESLANRLLDFSVAVRDQNIRVMGEFFDGQMGTVDLPHPPFPLRPSLKWLSECSVSPSDLQPVSLSREEALESWGAFLSGFSEIEDARFKVKDSEFTGAQPRAEGKGAIKYFLVGRDLDGRRLWVKGTGHVQARQEGEDGWSVTRLTFDSMDFMAARVDLFSEVSEPAGVAVSLPRYGTPGNDEFVYHGAAVGDINGNGFLDLVVTGVNRTYLYLNQGEGTFVDVADQVGLPPAPHATQPLLLDIDNDGDLDLFFAAVGHQMLFQNRLKQEGKLEFIDISQEAGVALPAHGFSATAGDVTGNGYPDIYVASYNSFGLIMPNSWHRATNGTANLLFLNQGDGTFREAAGQWGVRDTRWSYAAQFADLTGNGRLDLYVANDFGENALFVHKGDRFADRARELGVLDPGNGMGVSIADFNNDGILDIYVTNMSSTAGNRILNRLFPDAPGSQNVLRKLAAGNNLFQGTPEGVFEDVTETMGPFVANWAWGGVFYDFDNDGWPDLYSSNGFVSGRTMADT